jgi:hypothetical protein
MKTTRANWVLVGAGVALVVGFFLPWLDAGGLFGVSGWDFVSEASGIDFLTKVILCLVPLMGAALAIAGLGGGKPAANTAMVAGASILGYTFYKVAWVFFKASGVGLWLVLGAALLALIYGLASKSKS